MILKLLLLFAIILPGNKNILFGESNSLIGQVININKTPIYNVNIQAVNSDFGTTTDKDGFFVFKNINTNNITAIKVTHIGYDTKIINIIPPFNNITITLIENIKKLNEIVVTGNRQETYIKDVPVLTHVISEEDIKNSTYTSVKDILETTMPNVQNVMSSHAGTSNNEVKIQGLNNKYMLFLIDGARVSAEFAGNTDFTMLNLSNIEKIEIVEGGMSSLYGSSAIGGVVNIITKEHKKPYWIDYSYLYDNPLIISQSLNSGFNHKGFYYNLNLNQENSDGYDLTPVSNYESGSILKTLEKYSSKSIGHNLKYRFNNNYSIELNYKKYSNSIKQYYNYFVQIIDNNDPLYPNYYYSSLKNNTPEFEDYRYGLDFIWKKTDSRFNISINQEEHVKSNYFFNYTGLSCENQEVSYFCNNSNELIPASFVNAINQNKSILVQYNHNIGNHSTTYGYEQNEDSYSSFNVYKHTGDIGNDGQCLGSIDCWVQSIFGGINDTKNFSKKAFFIGYQITDNYNDKIAFATRYVDSKNFGNEFVYSFAHIIKRYQPLDIRFNFSKGFRIPAIKELYYNFQGHSPPVIGNPNLSPTTNNYFSFSINKILNESDFSIEVFYNDVKNMIGIDYDTDLNGEDILLYTNFNQVKFFGLNFSYENNISQKEKIKFVYNRTNPKSYNIEALEMISKNSFRLNYIHEMIDNKLKLVLNTKYADEKFFLDGSDKIILEDYFIVDMIFLVNIKKIADFKIGIKNIFDYKDNRRLLEDDFGKDILTSYDAGRRIVVGFNLNLNRENIKK